MVAVSWSKCLFQEFVQLMICVIEGTTRSRICMHALSRLIDDASFLIEYVI